jgi:hypothetical protein
MQQKKWSLDNTSEQIKNPNKEVQINSEKFRQTV